MSLKLFNTLTRCLEEFQPLEEGDVRMYTCGPTVYNYAHIGNYRAYVSEDLLRRYLKYRGYGVTQVMNLTDVDDKTIRSSQEKKLRLREFTQIYTKAFFEDLKTLNIDRAEFYPAATDHIPEMIDLIQRLMDKGVAYKSDDGSVYFSIAKFGKYGRLAHLDLSGMRAGARVAQDEYEKENVADFALWKAWDEKDGDVFWHSPWGRGRPGWHIECSAMSMKYLGETFDLHTGGMDNMFPHHEDEIAQSEAATGKTFVRYWLHCAHLVVDGKKMSKSLGNFYTLRDLLQKGYTGREIRYALLSTHYRQALNFTFESLTGARAALRRIDEFITRLRERTGEESGPVTLPAWAEKFRADFQAALDDDLNISGGLGALYDLIHAGHKALDENKLSPGEAGATGTLLEDVNRVLGFLEPEKSEVDTEAVKIMELRQQARKARNWPEADRLRDELAARGWVVQDTAQGPVLKKI